MTTSIKFDVFGRRILTIRSEKGWQLFYLSGDGKRRPADDLINKITIEKMITKYSVLLLDAYAVLVHSSGALPGAARLIDTLNRTKKPFYILTNDASKLPATSSKLFQSFGLAIAPDQIITSGSLLVDYFAAKLTITSRQNHLSMVLI